MENMKVKHFFLEDGNARFVCRNIMTETGLDPEAEVEYIGIESRGTGEGHYDCLYRIVGTNDLLRICHNHGLSDNPNWESVYVERDFF